MAEELVLRCALARGFLYNPAGANALVEQYGTAGNLYRNSRDEALDPFRKWLESSFSPENIRWAEEEAGWCEKKGVKLLFYGEKEYPRLLEEINDAPHMLYYKGSAPLNNPRSISVVGTRLASLYGKECCSRIVGHLEEYSPLIVSGLAYGIDISAHKAALEAGLETVAVLPNGIDTIYPSRHREVAARMVRQGGILTEFPRGEAPRRMNFIKRNRIIAAMSRALVVVESRVKGGSMITAELANGYGREIFAVPGRMTDPNSFGCNYLIAKNVAAVYNCASAIPSALGWRAGDGTDADLQPQLFSFEVEKKEKILLSLKFDKPADVEGICAATGFDWGEVSMLLLELELEGKVSVTENMEYCLRK